jgi:hypothetical protein
MATRFFTGNATEVAILPRAKAGIRSHSTRFAGFGGGADGGAVEELRAISCEKKQGATGITTVAPYVAG